MFIFSAFFTISLDRHLNSKCGWNCELWIVLDDQNYTNYLNFSSLSHLGNSISIIYYSHDQCICIHMFCIWICKLGVKFLFITWFEIKKRITSPQGTLKC